MREMSVTEQRYKTVLAVIGGGDNRLISAIVITVAGVGRFVWSLQKQLADHAAGPTIAAV